MSCDFNRNMLEEYALSLLDGDEKKAVAGHVASCHECKAAVMRRRQLLQQLNGAFDEEPPEWVVQKTVTKLKHRQRKPLRWRSWVAVSVYSGIAGVVLLILFQTGLHFGRLQFTDTGVATTGKPFDIIYESGSELASPKQVAGKGIVLSQVTKTGDSLTEQTSEDDSLDDDAIVKAELMFGLFFENPVTDPSIYKDLGVPEDIASLLL